MTVHNDPVTLILKFDLDIIMEYYYVTNEVSTHQFIHNYSLNRQTDTD